MKIRNFIAAAAAAVMMLPGIGASAKVVLPSLLGDNMVLQRNSDVRLWGKAEPGATVSIRTSWDGRSYSVRTSSEGNWTATVRTGEAGGPYAITFDDGTPLTLKNILLGEVWICSGQSNMEMPVNGFFGQPCKDALKTKLESYRYPLIRMFTVGRVPADEPQEDCSGEWKVSNPENVGRFSAVAYFFGRRLNECLGIPVGLITTNWGGTNIEAWMSSLDGLDVDREFIRKNWNRDPYKPSVLYNAMIHPLRNFTAKGFIWYQGEANRPNCRDYCTMQVEMVRQWRTAWNNEGMPFYFSQIAPYRYDGDELLAIPLLIEQQYKAMSLIPHSGIAATNDIGVRDIIHEPDKQAVGDRLAFMALSNDYGIEGLPAPAPTYKSMEKTDEGHIVLSFNNLGASWDNDDPRSLSWLDEDDNLVYPTGFEIAGKDRVFHKADAKIIWGNNQIEVWSDEIPQPEAVRYGFRNYIETNVKTILGQPLVPFRTDDWEIPEEELIKEY